MLLVESPYTLPGKEIALQHGISQNTNPRSQTQQPRAGTTRGYPTLEEQLMEIVILIQAIALVMALQVIDRLTRK